MVPNDIDPEDVQRRLRQSSTDLGESVGKFSGRTRDWQDELVAASLRALTDLPELVARLNERLALLTQRVDRLEKQEEGRVKTRDATHTWRTTVLPSIALGVITVILMILGILLATTVPHVPR